MDAKQKAIAALAKTGFEPIGSCIGAQVYRRQLLDGIFTDSVQLYDRPFNGYDGQATLHFSINELALFLSPSLTAEEKEDLTELVADLEKQAKHLRFPRGVMGPNTASELVGKANDCDRWAYRVRAIIDRLTGGAKE